MRSEATQYKPHIIAPRPITAVLPPYYKLTCCATVPTPAPSASSGRYLVLGDMAWSLRQRGEEY